jgi:hypothetical protein
MTSTEVRELGGQIRGELLKDDRVSALTVIVRPDSTAKELSIELAITPVALDVGAFSLTLSATSAAILITEIRESR